MPLREHSVERLTLLLCEELSAVETYHRLLSAIPHASVRDRLRECLRDHERRVELLRQRIEALGGKPKERPGRGTGFAKVTQAGSSELDEHMVVDALEEGESYELEDYMVRVGELTGETRRFVEQELLPAQRRTREMVGRIREQLA